MQVRLPSERRIAYEPIEPAGVHQSEDWFLAWSLGGGDRRLDDRIRDRVPALSKERVKVAFAAGRISVDGVVAEPATRVRAGARLELTVTAEDAMRQHAGPKGGDGFFMLYRDDDVMIVDKEPGVLTVPTDEGEKAGLGQSGDDSLVERVAAALSIHPRTVMPVHRIDRFTSGILVIARSEQARRPLIEQFSKHSITRRYLAITNGVPEPRTGTFRSHLVSDVRRKQHVTGKSSGGDLAITHYEVIEEVRGGAVVLVALETGKRNQIRVHFAEAGWPLVGEHKYGDKPDKQLSRQALHAAELEFLHPRHGSPVSAASPLPPDMRDWLQRHALKPKAPKAQAKTQATKVER